MPHAPYAVSVVVPIYNEAQSLPKLYEELTAVLTDIGVDYEIILVDDGSTDDSATVAKELQQSDSAHLRFAILRRNFGQTAAMAAGFDLARHDVIIPIDADLQNDPGDIPRLLDKMNEGYDVVSGWRSERKDKLLSRRMPSVVANSLISTITGVKLHDYGCTLKAYRREVTSHMKFYGELHRFLPVLASWAGARVAEVEVNHRPREFGTSKYGMDRTLRVILDLMTIKFLLSYSTKPMQVFGKWGLAAMLVGFATGLLTLGQKLWSGQDVSDNAWLFVSMLFSLAGLQLICMGLLGEISVRTYYESQQKRIYTIRERSEED